MSKVKDRLFVKYTDQNGNVKTCFWISKASQEDLNEIREQFEEVLNYIKPRDGVMQIAKEGIDKYKDALIDLS